MSMGDSINGFRIFSTQIRESAQATSQRMDIVQQQVTSIRFDLQEQLNKAVHEAKSELRTEFAAMLNIKVVSLKARVESQCQ